MRIDTHDHFLRNFPAGIMYATLGLHGQSNETPLWLIKEAECHVTTVLSAWGLPK